MNKIVARFKNLLNISFLMVALDILVGLVLLFYTELAANVALVMIGCLMVVHGLFSFINYFYDGLGNKIFSIELIYGIVSLLIGVFVILNPITTIDILGVGFGIWLVVNGLEVLYYTVKFGKAHEDITSLIAFIGVIGVIMGILVIINPFSKFMLINKLVGLFVVASGVFTIVRIILFKKRAEKILKIFE